MSQITIPIPIFSYAPAWWQHFVNHHLLLIESTDNPYILAAMRYIEPEELISLMTDTLDGIGFYWDRPARHSANCSKLIAPSEEALTMFILRWS